MIDKGFIAVLQFDDGETVRFRVTKREVERNGKEQFANLLHSRVEGARRSESDGHHMHRGPQGALPNHTSGDTV